MKYPLFAALLCGTLLVSCGDKHAGDPKDAYAGLVKAAQKGDGGAMYDYLDSNFRAQVDQMMEVQAKNKDQMPPDERAKWEQMNGLKGRDAFAKMVTLNKEMMTSRFQGEYKVLKVDTLVVLTVQHTGQPAELMFLRYEKGGYRVTAPPSPPSQMPASHPQVPNPHMAPPDQGGAAPGGPNGAAEGNGAPAPPPAPNK